MDNSPTPNPIGQKPPTYHRGDTLKARRKKAPDCFHCRKVRARPLPGIGPMKKYTVFCSTACATQHAIRTVVESRYTWCITHKKWSNRFGICQECELVKIIDRGGSLFDVDDILDNFEEYQNE